MRPLQPDRPGGRLAGPDRARPGPVQVVGDPARLRQLVTILVDNAIRHGPIGGTVGVIVRNEGREAVLTVDDDGPGIPPDDRARVFDRFWRASDAQTGWNRSWPGDRRLGRRPARRFDRGDRASRRRFALRGPPPDRAAGLIGQAATTRSRPAALAIASPTSAAMNSSSACRRHRSTRAHPADTVARSASPSLPVNVRVPHARRTSLAIRTASSSVAPVEDRHELLAAVAGDEVARPEPLAQQVAEAAQDHVPDPVAVALVERAEVVEVEQDRPRPAGAGPGFSRTGRRGTDRSRRRGGGG